MLDIWCEKYRPDNINKMILSEDYINKFSNMINNKQLSGNLLFYGKPGSGKTTLAKILAKSVSSDVKFINASDEGNIETVRTKIRDYAEGQTFGNKYRIVILDEFDGFRSNDAFLALRPIIEMFSDNLRLIATCNYIQKIPAPILSRFQTFEFKPIQNEDMVVYIKEKVLKVENVVFKDEDLLKVIINNKGDFRRTLNDIQGSLIGNNLKINTTDKIEELMKIIQLKNNIEALKKFLAENQIDYLQVYKYLFDKTKVPRLLLLIAEYMKSDYFVMDKEINFCAFIISMWNL
jgi:DNA polymerase III delta prime subunit